MNAIKEVGQLDGAFYTMLPSVEQRLHCWLRQVNLITNAIKNVENMDGLRRLYINYV